MARHGATTPRPDRPSSGRSNRPSAGVAAGSRVFAERRQPNLGDTRQPLPVSSPGAGHSSRGAGGVPSGRGETNRAEISPPPVTRIPPPIGSTAQPSEQMCMIWPVSQLTVRNQPGHPLAAQRRRRAPVVRPSISPDRLRTTSPSGTRPSSSTSSHDGHESASRSHSWPAGQTCEGIPGPMMQPPSATSPRSAAAASSGVGSPYRMRIPRPPHSGQRDELWPIPSTLLSLPAVTDTPRRVLRAG